MAAGTWWTKCNVVKLDGSATSAYVYGKGTNRATAQAKANTYVPNGYRAKHCSERSIPTNKIPDGVLKAGGGLVGDYRTFAGALAQVKPMDGRG